MKCEWGSEKYGKLGAKYRGKNYMNICRKVAQCKQVNNIQLTLKFSHKYSWGSTILILKNLIVATCGAKKN